MVKKVVGFDRRDILVDRDDYFDVNDQSNIAESDYKRYARMLEEEPLDDDYKTWLSFLTKKLSTKLLKKRGGKDECAPETDRDSYTYDKDTVDRENGLWFRKLTEDGKSYVLGVERDGLPFVKYEGQDDGLKKEKCFSDYKRKLKDGSKKDYGPLYESNFALSEEEVEDLDRGELRSGAKNSSGPSYESSFTSSEELGRRNLISGSRKYNGTSSESRFTLSEEAEDSGGGKFRSGETKSSGPSNKSRFTSSEEECEDLDRRKLRSGSRNSNGPLSESIFTLSKEAEDSDRRKLRSTLKKNIGPSNESRCTSTEEEAEDSGQRKLRSGGAKSKKMENGDTSSVETEPDYRVLLRGIKYVEGWAVFEDSGERVVLEESNGEKCYHQKDDDWGPFVEILDRATFYNELNSNPSVEAATDGLKNTNKDKRHSNLGKQFEFRCQLIAALRKPYDKEEYNQLWQDINIQKPEKRHLDLRYGRDISCSTSKNGKSYLDHHPDLKKELKRLGDDNKPKRLNLLRGFFFWLKKASQDGSFHPWRDKKCLAIIPGSG